MAFIPNNSQQITFDDTCFSLTEREKRFLKKSWAHYFSEHIFPKINEERFSVLYSSNKASRPGTPVNIVVGALLLKDLRSITDDELVEALMFDTRYQYALHTTSMNEQPVSDRTLSRFRAKCLEYENNTGIDLIKEEIVSLSAEMAAMMNIDGSMKRMDSMMIASNIKRLSRLELLYTCLSNLICELDNAEVELPEELLHYTKSDDRNNVIYHSRNEETSDRIETVLTDCKTALELCDENYESSSYLMLNRVLNEQTVMQEDGSYRLRTKEDGGMNGDILQNPADPDATFRVKAGNQNIGYSANFVESVGDNGSIVTDYDLEPNTHSDSEFAKEAIESMGPQENKVTLVADGAYGGTENTELADANNIDLVTTNMTGRKTKDIHADFEFSEDGTSVVKCPGGHTPEKCSFNSTTEQCTATFDKEICKECPFYKECNPKLTKHKAKVTTSVKRQQRAKNQRFRKSDEFSMLTKFRNGVESVPSYLRRSYNVDHMPVRGLKRCRMLFGLKIGASNIMKFCRYMQDLDLNTQIQANA